MEVTSFPLTCPHYNHMRAGVQALSGPPLTEQFQPLALDIEECVVQRRATILVGIADPPPVVTEDDIGKWASFSHHVGSGCMRGSHTPMMTDPEVPMVVLSLPKDGSFRVDPILPGNPDAAVHLFGDVAVFFELVDCLEAKLIAHAHFLLCWSG